MFVDIHTQQLFLGGMRVLLSAFLHTNGDDKQKKMRRKNNEYM